MSRPDVTARAGAPEQRAGAAERTGPGWAHVSFSLPGRDDVDRLAADMAEAGVRLVDGPRQTGDGYYEAVVLDPEGNRVELLAGDYSDDVALRPSH